MKYNIPKKIELGGQVIKVRVLKNIRKKGCTGYCDVYKNEILVQTHIKNGPIAKSQVEQTFWHEYAHFLIDHTRKEALSDNEEFIDLLGEFLYQSVGKHVQWV